MHSRGGKKEKRVPVVWNQTTPPHTTPLHHGSCFVLTSWVGLSFWEMSRQQVWTFSRRFLRLPLSLLPREMCLAHSARNWPVWARIMIMDGRWSYMGMWWVFETLFPGNTHILYTVCWEWLQGSSGPTETHTFTPAGKQISNLWERRLLARYLRIMGCSGKDRAVKSRPHVPVIWPSCDSQGGLSLLPAPSKWLIGSSAILGEPGRPPAAEPRELGTH